MRFKTIRFEFPNELSESEEDAVIDFFLQVKKQTSLKLDFAIGILGNPLSKTVGGAYSGILLEKIRLLRDNLNDFMKLSREERRIFTFYLSWRDFEFGNMEMIPKKAREILKARQSWEKIQEKVPAQFRKYVRAELKMNPGIMKITHGEGDWDGENREHV